VLNTSALRGGARELEVGAHVSWNSEAGPGERRHPTKDRKITKPVQFKSHTVHASTGESQYVIESDKT